MNNDENAEEFWRGFAKRRGSMVLTLAPILTKIAHEGSRLSPEELTALKEEIDLMFEAVRIEEEE